MKNIMPPINTPDNAFHDGNPATGEQGTIVPGLWLNNIQGATRNTQQELISVLNEAEIEIDETKDNQLLTAILSLITANIPDLPVASLTQAGIVKLISSLTSDSESLAATAKAVKLVANAIVTSMSDHIQTANPHHQYLAIANFLSEIKDVGPAAVAQTLLNLGLGDAAKKNVGTASGTVAAGNDVRFNETTIMYPDGSGASPYNYPANTRKEYANPFPGKNIIVVAEVYYNGVWGQTGWFSNSTVTNAVGILATQNIATDVIVVQSGSFGVLAAATLCGSLHAATATQSTLPFRLKVYKEA
ncbi:TPA: tail fiber protein [Yersinia enterocolitica]|nr:tail fiber protein [Yersinia enterocolitica]